jgi:hypothetical protein
MAEKERQLSPEEVIRRRDEAVRRALNTPPRSYKDSKVGAKKSKPNGASGAPKKR